MFFNLFNKKHTPAKKQEPLVTIILYHDNGTMNVRLPNLTKESIKVITDKLGRDEIFVQGAMHVNLSSFHVFQIEDSSDGSSVDHAE